VELLTLITKKLESKDKKVLVKNLEYNSTVIGIKTLDKFIISKSLHSWLSSGHYDFVYTSLDFVEKLCIELDIEPILYKKEIALAINTNHGLDKFKNSYIFIYTNFKRTSEPIIALAMMEGRRRIEIKKENFIFKNLPETINIVSTIVKDNYNKTDGRIALWGEIKYYIYNHIGGQRYLFNINGNLIEDIKSIVESKAQLEINNKILNIL